MCFPVSAWCENYYDKDNTNVVYHHWCTNQTYLQVCTCIQKVSWVNIVMLHDPPFEPYSHPPTSTPALSIFLPPTLHWSGHTFQGYAHTTKSSLHSTPFLEGRTTRLDCESTFNFRHMYFQGVTSWV